MLPASPSWAIALTHPFRLNPADLRRCSFLRETKNFSIVIQQSRRLAPLPFFGTVKGRAWARVPLVAEKSSVIIGHALAVSFHIRAEVVELADTPSARIALEILYKLLIINLLPFASITSNNAPRNGQ